MPLITPPTLSPADIEDAGRVRLGAGLRAAAKPVPAFAAAAGQNCAPRPLPPAVADAGKVRLGAGLRR
jgi:hypothetical protein